MTINEYIPVPDSTDYPLWVAVTDEKWEPGYEVSYSGEVRAPSGKLLTPNRQGRNLWVSLRRQGGKPTSARLDKLILTAFNGPAPDDQGPVHKDGDLDNCSIFNLSWGEPSEDTTSEPDEYAFDKLAQAMRDSLFPGMASPSEITVPEMGFTTRTQNILTRYNIANAGELTLLTRDDLLQMLGGGEKFVREISERLEMLGLKLAEEPQEQPTYDFDYSDYAPPQPEPKKRRRRRRAVSAPGGGEVEVHRLYKLGNLQLTVNDKGQGELSKKSRLTTTDMATLAELLQRAVEMNRIMGLK